MNLEIDSPAEQSKLVGRLSRREIFIKQNHSAFVTVDFGQI